MPTKRIRISRRAEERGIPEELWCRFTGTELPRTANYFRFAFPRDPVGDWDRHRDVVLVAWIRKHPGTRPQAWWEFDAPEPRRRLGGKGTPCHGVLAHAARYASGIPEDWIADFWIVDQGVKAERFDADDAPVFESQAAYLRRLRLLHEREGTRLSLKDYQAEPLRREFGPDDDNPKETE